ncbi:hypothetical protein NL676_012445 [Syzygium grande]|nr:hypothetical protein NL676_012445 [Syzygium grande]
MASGGGELNARRRATGGRRRSSWRAIGRSSRRQRRRRWGRGGRDFKGRREDERERKGPFWGERVSDEIADEDDDDGQRRQSDPERCEYEQAWQYRSRMCNLKSGNGKTSRRPPARKERCCPDQDLEETILPSSSYQ